MRHIPRLIIAAPSSGSGKTTLSSLLIAALKARALTIQPFKVGPDYLDPTHLTRLSGRQTRNVDSFFLPAEGLRAVLAHGMQQPTHADIALIEGVMGLFDGKDALGTIGSTAHIAKSLAAPVILVVDAKAMAGSVAALVRGFYAHDPAVNLVGVIANRVGSERHATILRDALAAVQVPLLGFVLRDESIRLPSRHLGLYGADETSFEPSALQKAAQHLDIDTILALSRSAPPLPEAPPLTSPAPQRSYAKLAVAYDAAFSFYYPENLELLRANGADLAFFSPLTDKNLPPDVSGVYLGGGYPERFAKELSDNVSMRQALKAFQGIIYGECGGLMYLCEALVTDEARFEMVGRVPHEAYIQQLAHARPTLGYRDMTLLHDTPIARAGWRVLGHEFHYSKKEVGDFPVYHHTDSPDVFEGYAHGKVHASYVHLYFPSAPQLAARFVESAACPI